MPRQHPRQQRGGDDVDAEEPQLHAELAEQWRDHVAPDDSGDPRRCCPDQQVDGDRSKEPLNPSPHPRGVGRVRLLRADPCPRVCGAAEREEQRHHLEDPRQHLGPGVGKHQAAESRRIVLGPIHDGEQQMAENDDDEADPADGIDDAITVLGGVLCRL